MSEDESQRIGIVEKAYKNFFGSVIRNYGNVYLRDIGSFVLYLKKNKYDAHILIGGPNGVGKSMVELAIIKQIDPLAITQGQILYAFNTPSDFIKQLTTLRDTGLGVDEIGRFLHNRQSMAIENIAITNSIEISREHRVAIISCCKDGRRVDKTYRDGKVQIYIFLMDRFDDAIGKAVTYGFVFANEIGSVFEIEDKFMLGMLEGIISFDEMRVAVENNVPTFVGYLFMDDIHNYITQEELEAYEKKKEEGIQSVNANWVKKAERKAEMNTGEDIRHAERAKMNARYAKSFGDIVHGTGSENDG